MANFDNGGSGPLARVSVKGTVKWFNATKGYGFVTLEDGADAFCHASALAAQGAPNLPQGSTLICDLQDSPRGLQVVAVHNVDTSTADPMPARKPRRDFGDGDRFGGDRFGGGRGDQDGHDRFSSGDRFGGTDRFSSGGGYGERDSGSNNSSGGQSSGGAMVEGKVKFFNDQKGFGFVMPEGGGGDVYIHASALRRSGVSVIEPEQRIRYSTRQGSKGVEVDRVELI